MKIIDKTKLVVAVGVASLLFAGSTYAQTTYSQATLSNPNQDYVDGAYFWYAQGVNFTMAAWCGTGTDIEGRFYKVRSPFPDANLKTITATVNNAAVTTTVQTPDSGNQYYVESHQASGSSTGNSRIYTP